MKTRVFLRTLHTVTAVLALGAVVSCESGKTNGTAPSPTPGPSSDDAPAVSASNPAGLPSAVIKGKVVFNGTAPKARKLDLGGNPDCKRLHAGGPGLISQRFVVGANGELANTIVWVSKGAAKSPPPSEPVVLDQKRCRYSPHALVVQAGQTLEIVNSDPFMHNVHPRPASNPEKNRPMPKGSPPWKHKFRRAESKPVAIRCDVHTWMNAYVAVLDHPYGVVTKADGTFELPKIAPGTYTITAWHEAAGEKKQQITVGEGETKEATFEFKG